MLKLCPRSPQSYKSCQHWQVLFPTPQEVGVENPSDGRIEKITKFIAKEPLPVDPHLNVEDFSLSSQLAAGMNLRDCGTYIHCTSPEQFDAFMSDKADALAAYEASKLKESSLLENVSSNESISES